MHLYFTDTLVNKGNVNSSSQINAMNKGKMSEIPYNNVPYYC